MKTELRQNSTVTMDGTARVSKCRQLIYLVKNRPILYNFHLKEHKNRTATEDTWQDISNQLSVSVGDCKAKWISLRNCYGRALRDERSNKGNRRRTWYLADDMAFLREFMNRTNYFETRFKESEEGAERTVSSASIPDQQKDNSFEPSGFEKAEPDDVEEYDYSQVGSPENESYQDNQYMETGNNSPEMSAQGNHNPSASHDSNADTMFFRSLLEDFKKISRRRQRAFKEAMLSAMNKLLDEEEAQLENPVLGHNQIRIAQVKSRVGGFPSDQSFTRDVCSSSMYETVEDPGFY